MHIVRSIVAPLFNLQTTQLQDFKYKVAYSSLWSDTHSSTFQKLLLWVIVIIIVLLKAQVYKLKHLQKYRKY